MAALGDLEHLRQAQSRQGMAIGGIKSALGDDRRRAAALEARVSRLEDASLSVATFLAVYCLATLLLPYL